MIWTIIFGLLFIICALVLICVLLRWRVIINQNNENLTIIINRNIADISKVAADINRLSIEVAELRKVVDALARINFGGHLPTND